MDWTPTEQNVENLGTVISFVTFELALSSVPLAIEKVSSQEMGFDLTFTAER